MKKNTRRALTASALLSTALATSAASAQELKVGDVSYVGAAPTAKLRAVKVGAADAVEVTGANTPVKLDCTPAVSKAGANKALQSIKVGIQHVDKGTHGFEIALLPTAQAPGSKAALAAGFQCNGRSPVTASLVCDGVKPGAKAGSAVIKPTFAGSKTFSVTILKNGKQQSKLAGQTGAVTIPDFDAADDGKEETLGITLAYGLERKDAWTMKVEHEEYTVLITAEAAQKPLVGGAALTVKTTGLDAIKLVGQDVRVGDVAAAPSP